MLLLQQVLLNQSLLYISAMTHVFTKKIQYHDYLVEQQQSTHNTLIYSNMILLVITYYIALMSFV